MYQAIVFLPLAGFLIAGLFGRDEGDEVDTVKFHFTQLQIDNMLGRWHIIISKDMAQGGHYTKLSPESIQILELTISDTVRLLPSILLPTDAWGHVRA